MTVVLKLKYAYDGAIGALDTPANASVTLADSTHTVTVGAIPATYTPSASAPGGLLSAVLNDPLPAGIAAGDAGTATWTASIAGAATIITVQSVVIQPETPAVPVPPGGSLPGGGSVLGGAYGLSTGYSSGDSPSASGFDLLSALAQNGIGGALAAIGAGTIYGGTAGAANGLSLPVAAWAGILPASSSRAALAAGTAPSATLAVPPNSQFVVYAAPVAGALADGTAYDTAESGVAELVVIGDGTVPDGGLALITGTSSASAVSVLTDVRVLVGAAVVAGITALSARVTADEARLRALESAGQGGPTAGIVVFWGALARSQSDPTLLAAWVLAQIPPAPLPPTPLPLITDIAVANGLKAFSMIADLGVAAVKAGDMASADLIASLDTSVDVYFYDPRVHGLDPLRIDIAHTTAPIDVLTGFIG